MSTTHTQSTTTTMPKTPLILSTRRIFWSAFAVILPFNFVLLLIVFAFGLDTGFNAEFGVSWNSLWQTVGAMFGGFGNLILLAAFAALLWAIFAGSNRLSKVRPWIPGLLVLAALVIGMLAYQLGWIAPQDINLLGLLPVLLLIAFTALEAALVTIALRYIRRRTPKN